MQLICDLEVHSKYARAVSRYMMVPEMAKWARWKGIDIIGTGDCTHPLWLAELKEALVEDGTGLLQLRSDVYNAKGHSNGSNGDRVNPRFILTGEVSLIYSQGGQGRRVHIIIVAPSLQAVEMLNQKLTKHGKLASDGRPVLGLSAKQLLTYVLAVNADLGLTDDPADPAYRKGKAGLYLIPAHVWTPWFGLYGSKSGFDSLEECFEELTPHIRAIETGLSSDLLMNWRLSANDTVSLVSFSDAHSAPNLMREATVIAVQERSYGAISQALQNPSSDLDPHTVDPEKNQNKNQIIKTLEFFPEEGKYHYDGIADQKLRLSPAETAKLRQKNPALARKVTVGVLSRVEELADRPADYRPSHRPPGQSVIPLQEIIAAVKKVGKQSKKVQAEYERLVEQVTEYCLLTEASESELRSLAGDELATAILLVRRGDVKIEPGYDGIYGTIEINWQGHQAQQKLDL